MATGGGCTDIRVGHGNGWWVAHTQGSVMATGGGCTYTRVFHGNRWWAAHKQGSGMATGGGLHTHKGLSWPQSSQQHKT